MADIFINAKSNAEAADIYTFKNYDPIKTFQGKSIGTLNYFIDGDGNEFEYELPITLLEAGFFSYLRLMKEYPEGVEGINFNLDLAEVFKTLDGRLQMLCDLPFVVNQEGQSWSWEILKTRDKYQKINIHLQTARQFKALGASSDVDFLTNAGYLYLNFYLLDKAIGCCETLRKYEYGLTELLDIFGTITSILVHLDFLESMDQMVSMRAKKAAHAKNQENNALRDEAIAYYIANKHLYASRIAASREISKKIVPVTERTIDGWIKEHEQTSTPAK